MYKDIPFNVILDIPEGHYYFTEEQLNKIQTYPDSPCVPFPTYINGVKMALIDFGSSYDKGVPYSPRTGYFGCKNRVFEISEAVVPKRILEKYKLNAAAYRQIQRKLAKILQVGRCALCD